MLNVNAVSLDRKEKIGSLMAFARLLTLHGDLPNVERAVQSGRFSSRVQEITKTAVAAGSTADPAWAGTVAPYADAVSAFLESLVQNLFDKILSDNSFRRVPLRGRGVVVTTGASGQNVTKDR